MKIPFRRTMTQKTENTIAALTKRSVQLDTQRSAAQAALDKATKARQDAFLRADEIDEQKIAKLQRAVSDAASLLQGIDDAIGILSQEKAQAEAQLHAEHDRIEREAAATALEAQVATIEAKLPEWLATSRAFSEALTAIGRLRHFESTEMARFIESATAQVEVAANFSLGKLKTWPNMIRSGQLPIPREEPKPVPVVAEPAPETRRLFTLRSVRWTNDSGKLQVADQYTDVDLPERLAGRALRCGACISISDDRRKQHRGAHGGRGHPNPEHAVDLDAVDDASGARYAGPNDPVLREAAAFTVIDRSADARVIQIAAGRAG
jgi:hypothetical protein